MPPPLESSPLLRLLRYFRTCAVAFYQPALDEKHAHLHLHLFLLLLLIIPHAPPFCSPPPFSRGMSFFNPFIYIPPSHGLCGCSVWAVDTGRGSCEHYGDLKRGSEGKKKQQLKKRGGTPHLSLCLSSSSSSSSAAAAAAARHPRIMQHLKPWRALLLLTVLWQPGMSDKYGRMMMTVRRMRVKAEIRLLCLPRAVVHDVSAAFYDFMVI